MRFRLPEHCPLANDLIKPLLNGSDYFGSLIATRLLASLLKLVYVAERGFLILINLAKQNIELVPDRWVLLRFDTLPASVSNCGAMGYQSIEDAEETLFQCHLRCKHAWHNDCSVPCATNSILSVQLKRGYHGHVEKKGSVTNWR